MTRCRRLMARSGTIVMLAALLCPLQSGAAEGEQTMMESREYAGASAELPVAFRHPAAWRLQEERGRIDAYREVRLLGARNDDKTYTSSFVVRSAPLRSAGGRYGSLQELVAAYTTSGLHGGILLTEQSQTVAGVPAMDLIFSYRIPPLHHRGLVPKEIPVTTHAVLLEHDGRLYELLYSADTRDYNRFTGEFDELLRSFRFQP